MSRAARVGRAAVWPMALVACATAGDAGLPEPRPRKPPTVAARPREDPAPAPRPAPPEPLDPPRVLTDPGSGVHVVWASAAAAATVVGSQVVVLEPDLRHLGTYRWSDGEPRWRIELPDPGPAVRLHGLGERVLLHAGDRVTVVEAARGRVLGEHRALPWVEPEAPELHERLGACAWVAPCGIQVLDCTEAAPLGPAWVDPAVPACRRPELLGRHGASIVLLASAPPPGEAASPGAAPGPTLMGLQASGGTVAWPHPLPHPDARVGATDDGACWILDERASLLTVLDCGSGAPRWEQPLGPGALRAHGTPGAVVVAREHGGRWRLVAHDTADGRPRWSTRLARRQHPLLPQGPLPDDAQALGTRRSYGLVDPVEGRVVGELVAGRDEALWRDPTGGFVLIGRDLRELDAEGRLVRQRPFSAARVQAVTSTHLVVQEGDALEVYDRDQLRERARLEGRLRIDATAALPDDRLLLRRDGDDGVVLVLGLQEPARPGARRE